MLALEGNGLVESKKLGRGVTSQLGGFMIDPEIDIRLGSDEDRSLD